MARKRELTIEELKRKPILTTTDIGRLAGFTRQAAHNQAVKGTIPAKRVRRYKGQYRFKNTPDLLEWCEERRRGQDARPVYQPEKLYAAKQSGLKFMESEATYLKHLDQCMKSWHEAGKHLYELKKKVPRGTWRTYLHANFKELGKTPSSIESKARLCIAIWRANQDKSDPSKFSRESVRKFRLALLPSKNYAAN